MFNNFQILLAVLLPSVQSRRRQKTCQEPANEKLEIASALYEIYTDLAYRNFTLNNVACFKDALNMPIVTLDKKRIPRKCKSRRRGKHALNCLEDEIDGSQKHNGAASIQTACKWNYVQDIEDDRIPRLIAKAQCACQHCHRGNCQHVYSYIPVLKKRCNRVTGVFVYKKFIYEVPVGCVCVQSKTAGRPKTRPKHRRVMKS